MTLASELLSHRRHTGAVARRALERFQRRAHACEVAFWDISEAHATRLLRAGTDADADDLVVENRTDVFRRLRGLGAHHCRGAAAVAESTKPLGAQSFVMVPSPGKGPSVATLVIGWSGEEPPCETGTLTQLRVAAGVLDRAVSRPEVEEPELARRLLRSLGDRIAIVDRDGVVLAANAAWRAFVGQQAIRLDRVRGASDRETAFDEPTVRAASLRERVLAVARGHSSFAQVPCGCESTGTQSCVLTITPLRHRAGGAAIVHSVSRGETSTGHSADPASTETASNIVAASEAERRRIGRALHNDFGQRAALLAVKLENILRDPNLASTLGPKVLDAKRDVEQLAIAMHDLSQELHPARLHLLGLERTLAAHCRDVSKDADHKVRFRLEGQLSGIDEPLALCVFRVAQEALRKAVAHRGAADVDVTLAATPSHLRLVVNDRSRSPDASTPQGLGAGLLIMRERVHAAGGTLLTEAGPRQETIVTATFPLARDDNRDWG